MALVASENVKISKKMGKNTKNERKVGKTQLQGMKKRKKNDFKTFGYEKI